MKNQITQSKVINGTVYLITLITLAFTSLGVYLPDEHQVIERQYATIQLESNAPIGEAKGIFPGRVVWVHDTAATNENCDVNTWYLPANQNQTVIDNMVSSAIQALTGTTSDAVAWDSIFHFHNREVRGRGNVGYQPGEKIFLKINAVSGWTGNYDTTNIAKTSNVSETSLGIILAVLRHLVYEVGVAESDIYVGDPLRYVYKHIYDICHAEFDSVHYLDYKYTKLGREKVVASTTAKIHYSDHGAILRPNVWYPHIPGGTTPIYNDYLYTIYEIADYIINLPMLKGHRRAGCTMFAKNHFGSHTRSDASHMHNGLVAPMEFPYITRPGYGLYRIQVDIMAHSLLGKKNLLYLMDALWATDYELGVPLKFQMPPFNNDYMNSIFASLDPVAIESVGYDFLRSEFTAERIPSAGTYVQMDGVDDYLHQAADSANWPDGIIYDPDSTGVLFASLGVHEHWNNPIDKRYSRNLGIGDGIELVQLLGGSYVYEKTINRPSNFALFQNYPNPFNPSTTIRYYLPLAEHVKIKVYNVTGQEVATLVDAKVNSGYHEVRWHADKLASGIYFYKMQAGKYSDAKKLIYLK